MRKFILLMGALVTVSGCNQSNDATTKQAANTAAPPPKKAPYCFFKSEELKGWTAKRDKDGNITVKGKAHVEDPRYTATLGVPTVTGSTAELSPTMSQNTGYASPDNWWDVSSTIPNSSAVTKVVISCGAKTHVDLNVPAAKSQSAQPGTS